MKLSTLVKRTPLAALLSLTALASLSSLPALALGDLAVPASTLSSQLTVHSSWKQFNDDSGNPPVCSRKPYLPQCGGE